MNTRARATAPEDSEAHTDWEALDSRVSTAVEEIQGALEAALGATRDLAEWVERLRTLSAFMRQVESGLVEVRHQLEWPSEGAWPVAVRSAVPRGEVPKAEEPSSPQPAAAEPELGQERPEAALETPEVDGAPEPSGTAVVAEGEQPPESDEEEPSRQVPSAAETDGSIRLEIESTGANIDLMVVERALRETPGVADVDLLDYAGKRATVRITLTDGEETEETGDPERLAGQVQVRLSKLVLDGSLSVSTAA